MKIIIPVIGFGPAGGYRVLSELANSWIKQGHEVDFLSSNLSDEPYFPIRARVIWIDENGIETKNKGKISKPKGWHHLKSLTKGLNLIGKKYDIILANHSFTAWPVAFSSCGEARKFYYIQAYEPEYYTQTKTIKSHLMALISALSYHLNLERIVNSEIYFRHKNLRATRFSPPGLDLEIFKPDENRRRINPGEKIIIGCIGRHEPQKGIIYVIRAFEELHKRDNRFFLRVAFGNLPESWTHEGCEIVVPKNDHELADYYRGLDVLVAPGTVQHGAAHYPVLEAGACGIPIITTGYMGATQETAWLVKNKSSDSIVEAISQIFIDEQKRFLKAGKFSASTPSYSWDIVSKKMISFFEGGDL